MLLEGSCHCGAVRFSVRSRHPYPYQRCYCGICRKTQGGGGYAVNLAADAETFKVTGKKHVAIYHARFRDPEDARAHTSTAERAFCSRCGSALWLFSPEWPELIHPFASAIDTPLPIPPERTHLMLDFKAPRDGTSDSASFRAGNFDARLPVGITKAYDSRLRGSKTKPLEDAMKRELRTVAAVALLGFSMGLLSACAPNPYDTANCQRHCSGVFGNYQSYNWWKTDQESN